jgi:hypothetical protein
MTKAKVEDMNKMFEDYEGDTGGYEDMTGATQSVPFIRLLQELSPQCRIKKEEYIEGAAPGMLVNTVTNKLYKTPVRFVVGKFERYYMEWKPNRGGLAGIHAVDVVEDRIGRDLIADEGFKIVDPRSGNEFSDTYVYYVILPDHMEDGVCILSLSSSSLKEAKKLNRNLRSTMLPNSTRRALPFFMIWNYEVKDMNNDKGDWVGPKFTLDGFVNQEQLTHVTEERAELPNKRIDLKLIEQDAGSTSKVDKDGKVPY